MKIIVQVFLMLFGAVPIVITLFGGVEGAYNTFVNGYQENGFTWLILSGSFFIALFWTWKDYKKEQGEEDYS